MGMWACESDRKSALFMQRNIHVNINVTKSHKAEGRGKERERERQIFEINYRWDCIHYTKLVYA